MSARIDTVVMDKTGTLTKGEPEVTDAPITDAPDGGRRIDEADPLALVAAVARESEHPLARAVVAHAERHATRPGADRLSARGFRNVPGHDALADVDGQRIVVGNALLLKRLRLPDGATSSVSIGRGTAR